MALQVGDALARNCVALNSGDLILDVSALVALLAARRECCGLIAFSPQSMHTTTRTSSGILFGSGTALPPHWSSVRLRPGFISRL